MITTDSLLEALDYNPETGAFSWKCKRRKVFWGMEAGTVDTFGYVQICVDYKRYSAHRLAWYFSYGKWPEGRLVHLNGVRTDNRIGNLMEQKKIRAIFRRDDGIRSQKEDADRKMLFEKVLSILP
jgi:hypothetical protein